MIITVDGMARMPVDEIKDVKRLKQMLTIQPRDMGYGLPDELECYSEKKGVLSVPRQFLLDRGAGVHEYDFRVEPGLPIDVPFAGTLFPDQQKAEDRVVNAFTVGNVYGGIVNMPAGTGKTVVSLSMISALGVKTLVLVHKAFLLNQWKRRIREFMPSARIGHVQRSTCDYRDKDIVIGMIQSLVGDRRYPEQLYKEFGLVVVDECHHMSAPKFSQSIPLFPAKYRLGLSATPYRKDGTGDLFKWHLGRVLYTAHTERLTPKIKRVSTSFRFVRTESFKEEKIPRGKLITIMSRSKIRNQVILKQIVGAANAGRKIIILSERVNHLVELEKMYCALIKTKSDVDSHTTAFYIGGLADDELAKSEKADVIFATYQMAREALDIPALDTLVFATPIGDIIQAAGRILRSHDEKKDPIIVDILDPKVKMGAGLYQARLKTYKKKGWL